MPKEEIIPTEGKIVELLRAGQFRVMLETGQEVLCKLSGKMRQNKIRLTLGDRVKVEMTPYDLTVGRIKHRL
jgi:translation initiation factor IF-1